MNDVFQNDRVDIYGGLLSLRTCKVEGIISTYFYSVNYYIYEELVN